MSDPVTDKRTELQALSDDDLAAQALTCRRLIRQTADDRWNLLWWGLIVEEADRRFRPEITETARWTEANEYRSRRVTAAEFARLPWDKPT